MSSRGTLNKFHFRQNEDSDRLKAQWIRGKVGMKNLKAGPTCSLGRITESGDEPRDDRDFLRKIATLFEVGFVDSVVVVVGPGISSRVGGEWN
jgi:hypothetical protein